MPKVIKTINLAEIEIGERRLVQRDVDGVPRWHLQMLYVVMDENGNPQGSLREKFVLVDEKYQGLFDAQIRAADDMVRFQEGLFDEQVAPEDPADVIKPKGKNSVRGASHV